MTATVPAGSEVVEILTPRQNGEAQQGLRRYRSALMPRRWNPETCTVKVEIS